MGRRTRRKKRRRPDWNSCYAHVKPGDEMGGKKVVVVTKMRSKEGTNVIAFLRKNKEGLYVGHAHVAPFVPPDLISMKVKKKSRDKAYVRLIEKCYEQL